MDMSQISTPEDAYRVALSEGPSDETRAKACEDPEWAYYYAFEVDRHPRDETRRAACREPQWAVLYAGYVDRYPRDDTRRAACGHPLSAFLYAVHVDRAYHEETYRAVRFSQWEREYEKLLMTKKEEVPAPKEKEEVPAPEEKNLLDAVFDKVKEAFHSIFRIDLGAIVAKFLKTGQS